MTEITLKPAPEGRVRKPDRSVLAEGGETVVLDTYWQRRIDQGDVEVIDAPEPAPEPEPAPAPASDPAPAPEPAPAPAAVSDPAPAPAAEEEHDQ